MVLWGYHKCSWEFIFQYELLKLLHVQNILKLNPSLLVSFSLVNVFIRQLVGAVNGNFTGSLFAEP